MKPHLEGLRVLRGPHWDEEDTDGGEGHLGTVQGSFSSGTVHVLWDMGHESTYRGGKDGKYDLRIFDSATVGVLHDDTHCASCGEKGIYGMVWHCQQCSDVDLCSDCYADDKHDIRHPFLRISFPGSPGKLMKKRKISVRIRTVGLFPGAKVMRGKHWQWKNQDGGAGSEGDLVEIMTEPNKRGKRNLAKVKWPTGKSNVYRMGFEGLMDIMCVDEEAGGFYYRDHLPYLDVNDFTTLEKEDTVVEEVKADTSSSSRQANEEAKPGESGTDGTLSTATNARLTKPDGLPEEADGDSTKTEASQESSLGQTVPTSETDFHAVEAAEVSSDLIPQDMIGVTRDQQGVGTGDEAVAVPTAGEESESAGCDEAICCQDLPAEVNTVANGKSKEWSAEQEFATCVAESPAAANGCDLEPQDTTESSETDDHGAFADTLKEGAVAQASAGPHPESEPVTLMSHEVLTPQTEVNDQLSLSEAFSESASQSSTLGEIAGEHDPSSVAEDMHTQTMESHDSKGSSEVGPEIADSDADDQVRCDDRMESSDAVGAEKIRLTEDFSQVAEDMQTQTMESHDSKGSSEVDPEIADSDADDQVRCDDRMESSDAVGAEKIRLTENSSQDTPRASSAMVMDKTEEDDTEHHDMPAALAEGGSTDDTAEQQSVKLQDSAGLAHAENGGGWTPGSGARPKIPNFSRSLESASVTSTQKERASGDENDTETSDKSASMSDVPADTELHLPSFKDAAGSRTEDVSPNKQETAAIKESEMPEHGRNPEETSAAKSSHVADETAPGTVVQCNVGLSPAADSKYPTSAASPSDAEGSTSTLMHSTDLPSTMTTDEELGTTAAASAPVDMKPAAAKKNFQWSEGTYGGEIVNVAEGGQRDDKALRVGDKAAIGVPRETLKELQADFGGVTFTMLRKIGRQGVVARMDKPPGTVGLRLGKVVFRVNREALIKIYNYQTGDTVRILSDLFILHVLNERLIWSSSMDETVGKVGEISKIDEDGDLRISFGNTTHIYSPACCVPAPGCAVDILGRRGSSRSGRGDGDSSLQHLADLLSSRGEGRRGGGRGESRVHRIRMEDLPDLSELSGLSGQLLEHLRGLGDSDDDDDDSSDAGRLHRAVQAGDVDKVKEMCRGNPSLREAVHSGMTPLMLASRKGKRRMVEALLDMGANVNATGLMDQTSLIAAMDEKEESIALLLLERGASPTLRNGKSRTPLHSAVFNRQNEAAQLLLHMGADVNAQDKYGDTPLHDAIARRNDIMVDLLLQQEGINLRLVNQKGFTPLHSACRAENTPILGLLLALDSSTVNVLKEKEFAPLHMCVTNNYLDGVRVLIDIGNADINLPSGRQKMTALHLACVQASKNIVQLLLEMGATVNVHDQNGETPLHLAMGGHDTRSFLSDRRTADIQTRIQISELLITFGAYVDAEDEQGRKPISCGHTDIQIHIKSFIDKNPGLVKYKTSKSSPSDSNGSEKCLGQVSPVNSSLPCCLCPRPSDVTLKPCGHRIICSTCVTQVQFCPSCGSEIAAKDIEGSASAHNDNPGMILTSRTTAPDSSSSPDINKAMGDHFHASPDSQSQAIGEIPVEQKEDRVSPRNQDLKLERTPQFPSAGTSVVPQASSGISVPVPKLKADADTDNERKACAEASKPQQIVDLKMLSSDSQAAQEHGSVSNAIPDLEVVSEQGTDRVKDTESQLQASFTKSAETIHKSLPSTEETCQKDVSQTTDSCEVYPQSTRPSAPLHDVYEEGTASEGNLLRIAVCRENPVNKDGRSEMHVGEENMQYTSLGQRSLPAADMDFADEKLLQQESFMCAQDNRCYSLNSGDEEETPCDPESEPKMFYSEDDGRMLPDLPSMPAGFGHVGEWGMMESLGHIAFTDTEETADSAAAPGNPWSSRAQIWGRAKGDVKREESSHQPAADLIKVKSKRSGEAADDHVTDRSLVGMEKEHLVLTSNSSLGAKLRAEGRKDISESLLFGEDRTDGFDHAKQGTQNAPSEVSQSFQDIGAQTANVFAGRSQSCPSSKSEMPAMDRSDLEKDTKQSDEEDPPCVPVPSPGEQMPSNDCLNRNQEGDVGARPVIQSKDRTDTKDGDLIKVSHEDIKTYSESRSFASFYRHFVPPEEESCAATRQVDSPGPMKAAPSSNAKMLCLQLSSSVLGNGNKLPAEGPAETSETVNSNRSVETISRPGNQTQAVQCQAGDENSKSQGSQPADVMRHDSQSEVFASGTNQPEREATPEKAEQMEEKESFRENDKVVIKVTVERLVELQQASGGVTDKMLQCMGQTGTVIRQTPWGSVQVKFGSGSYRLNPEALMLVPVFSMGDKVRVHSDWDLVKRLNERLKLGHGIEETLGKVGVIINIDKNLDITVGFGGVSFVFSPACCVLAPGATVDKLNFGMSEQTARITKSKHDSDDEDTFDQQTFMQTLSSMVKGGASVDQYLQSSGMFTSSISALFDAIEDGNLMRVKIMCQGDPALVNMVNERRHLTTLMFASWKGQLKIVKELLDMGADVNGTVTGNVPHDSRCALAAALESEHEDVAIHLLERGAEPNLVTGFTLRTPLHLAVAKNLLMVIQLLLEKGANINAQDSSGDTPLHDALIRRQTVPDIIDLLLSVDEVDFSIQDWKGVSPLHAACYRSNPRAVEQILARDTRQVNLLMGGHASPLHLAASDDSPEVIRLLVLMGGADVNIAAKGDHPGNRPLHHACLKGHYPSVEALLDFGAEVNVVNEDLDTPLHFAMGGSVPKHVSGQMAEFYIQEERVRIACTLISNGAYVDMENAKGRTCMRYGSSAITAAVQEFIDQNCRLVQKKNGRHRGREWDSEVRRTVDTPQTCRVCMNNTPEVTLLPCGHKAVCSQCSGSVSICPICQHRVDNTTTDDQKGALFEAIT